MKSKFDGTGNRREIGPAGWKETYDDIDVDLCRPHPLVLGMRFEYESEALERSIRVNGQLEPCRAVRDEEDGVHLLVYIGQRRLHATQSLKSKYEKPSTIKVIIDEDDLTDEELVRRALAENIDEKGQRLPMSDLEKISYCRDLFKMYDAQQTEKILTDSGFERTTARKIATLVDKFDSEKMARLHKIESKSDFRFKIAHLDILLACETEQNFYETASLAASSQKPPEEIKALRKAARYFSKDIPWFSETFPEFVHGEEESGDNEEGVKSGSEDDAPGKDSEKEAGSESYDSNSEDFGALPEPMILARCHYCAAVNPFKIRTGSPEFIFCNLKDGGLIEQLAIGANAVLDCERECSACHKTFWLTASVLEGGKMVVETSKSRLIEPPKQEASIRKVYWDQNGGGWMSYGESSKEKHALDLS